MHSDTPPLLSPRPSGYHWFASKRAIRLADTPPAWLKCPVANKTSPYPRPSSNTNRSRTTLLTPMPEPPRPKKIAPGADHIATLFIGIGEPPMLVAVAKPPPTIKFGVLYGRHPSMSYTH